jgi:hypothetical protein
MYSGSKYTGDVGQIIEGSATFSGPCTFNQTTHVIITTLPIDEQVLPLRRRTTGSAKPSRLALAAGISALLAALGTALTVADEPPSQCLWDGQTYSVGAIAPMQTNDVYACTFDPGAHPSPYWAPARNLGGAGVPRT